MKSLFNSLLLLLAVSFTFSACDKNDDSPEPGAGQLRINFAHHVDSKALAFDTIIYKNEADNEYSITEFKYYISNIKLHNTSTGQSYTEATSYHLVEPKANRTSFVLANVPFAVYDEIEFAIGVDSVANASIDQVGDLDSNNDMAWNWNTGYIFLKMEGKFRIDSTSVNGYRFHPGADKSFADRSYIVKRMKLNAPVMIGKSESYQLNFSTNVAEVLRTPNAVDLTTLNNVMFGPKARTIVDNYKDDMITINGLSKQ
ncbi:MAG: hypothetical protein LPJ89_01470 [Hymenobacteraceae bacterium]|nr:hypothetical protein [Hymenobacteraceae bacterium]MDX5395727.1 hypothetical protein [Hymenobacteraceae bacterium]MDX5442432.1 hypothetical protein [Hymenobacteraceae bacterium]MDX5511779.1 hypothetical protein [Hymenobacteraceae bacterium]